MAKSISNLIVLVLQVLNCIYHTISDEYPCQNGDATPKEETREKMTSNFTIAQPGALSRPCQQDHKSE